jgi:hypothetical protein
MKKEKYLAVSRWPLAISGLFFFFCFSNAACQVAPPAASGTSGEAYRLLFTIDAQAKNFTTDKLQNIYLLTPDNEVVKYTPQGQEQFRYPNKTLGNASCLDATNPFHLLLFFPDYQNVLTLDRTLNPTGQFNLLQFGLFQVNAVGMASDGRLWVFDEVDFRLKKFESDGTLVTEGNDLSLVLGKTIRPNFLVEKDQLVYLNDPKVGILVFDVFGQYQKTLPIQALTEFQVFEDQLIYFKEGKLYSFHLKALLESVIRLPEGARRDDKVKVQKDRLYLLGENSLRVFKF